MVSKKSLKTALEALEYFKKVNYCWSASEHPKYVRCQEAIREIKEELEKMDDQPAK